MDKVGLISSLISEIKSKLEIVETNTENLKNDCRSGFKKVNDIEQVSDKNGITVKISRNKNGWRNSKKKEEEKNKWYWKDKYYNEEEYDVNEYNNEEEYDEDEHYDENEYINEEEYDEDEHYDENEYNNEEYYDEDEYYDEYYKDYYNNEDYLDDEAYYKDENYDYSYYKNNKPLKNYLRKKKVKRQFGHYKCECGRWWSSAYSWEGYGQKCKTCGKYAYPYDLEDIIPSGASVKNLTKSTCVKCVN